MQPSLADSHSTLCAHAWNAGYQYYGLIQSIRFGPDAWGMMKHGSGQAITFEAKFQYSLPDASRLVLEFFDTPAWYDPEEELAFERTEGNSRRHVSFDLIPGPHETDFQTMGGMVKREFAWLLRFHSEPFPIGSEPTLRGNGPKLEYFGRPLALDRRA